MLPLHLRTLMIVLLMALFGCESNPAVPSTEGPFGPPSDSPLLVPFAGQWELDFDRTLAAFEVAGAPKEDLDRLRKAYNTDHESGKLHDDMVITGNESLCGPISEYRFFGMHQHDNYICGKAWHHEDRFDPGDMSKCYVRLSIKDGRLHFTVRMKDGLPDLGDPDLVRLPPAEGGSAATCDADHPAGKDWLKWNTYVFSRKQ